MLYTYLFDYVFTLLSRRSWPVVFKHFDAVVPQGTVFGPAQPKNRKENLSHIGHNPRILLIFVLSNSKVHELLKKKQLPR